MVTTAKPFGSGSMGEFTTIMARDGHEFQAWLARPPGRPRGAVVVVQEIFGVNAPHPRGHRRLRRRRATPPSRRRCSTACAAASSSATPPADMRAGRRLRAAAQPETTLKDIAAALAVVQHSGRVGVVGYCWGGALAYLAACQLPLACAVVYYGKVAGLPRAASRGAR